MRVWKNVEADVEGLLTSLSRKIFGDGLLGLLLFGSRARGDHRDESDYDILLLLKDYFDGDPVKTYCELPYPEGWGLPAVRLNTVKSRGSP